VPLEHGKSRAAFEHNVREMIKAGHPQKQAVAAAYREQREDRLDSVVAKCAAFDCRADSFDGLVKELESKGYSKEYATKIAGKVANEKKAK